MLPKKAVCCEHWNPLLVEFFSLSLSIAQDHWQSHWSTRKFSPFIPHPASHAPSSKTSSLPGYGKNGLHRVRLPSTNGVCMSPSLSLYWHIIGIIWLPFMHFNSLLHFYYCVCMSVCAVYVCAAYAVMHVQRASCVNQSSPSTMWVPHMELRSSGVGRYLYASAILPAPEESLALAAGIQDTLPPAQPLGKWLGVVSKIKYFFFKKMKLTLNGLCKDKKLN